MSQPTTAQYRAYAKFRDMKAKHSSNSDIGNDVGSFSEHSLFFHHCGSNIETKEAQKTNDSDKTSLDPMKQRIRSMRGFSSQINVQSERHQLNKQSVMELNQLLEHAKQEQKIQTDKIISKLDLMHNEMKENEKQMKQNQIVNNNNSYSQMEYVQDIHKLLDMKLNKYNKKLVNDIKNISESLQKLIHHEITRNNKQIISHMDRKWKEIQKERREKSNEFEQRQATKRSSLISETFENSQVFDILFDSNDKDRLPQKRGKVHQMRTYKRKRKTTQRKQLQRKRIKEINLFESSSDESSDEDDEEPCECVFISNRPQYKRRKLVNSMTSQYM